MSGSRRDIQGRVLGRHCDRCGSRRNRLCAREDYRKLTTVWRSTGRKVPRSRVLKAAADSPPAFAVECARLINPPPTWPRGSGLVQVDLADDSVAPADGLSLLAEYPMPTLRGTPARSSVRKR